MIRDLEGNYHITAVDIIEPLINDLNSMKPRAFKPHSYKNYGLVYDSSITTLNRKRGIYFIYVKDVLVYVGQSDTSIRKRLDCFGAVIKGVNTRHEGHSAAAKMRDMFEDVFNKLPTENLSMKFLDKSKLKIPNNMTMVDIEDAFISELNPVYNLGTLNRGKYKVLENLYNAVHDVTKAKQYAVSIARQLNEVNDIKFRPNYHSYKGVVLDSRVIDKGVYCIYRYGIPIYVGYSGNAIRERLGKFCAVVRCVNRKDEDHIGAKRYRQVFGDDFEGLSVRAVEYHQGSDINVTLSSIAEEVANILDATFNNKNYRSTREVY